MKEIKMFSTIKSKWLRTIYKWTNEINVRALNEILIEVKENKTDTWDLIPEHSEGYLNYRLECHKENLRKGGLIPRVEPRLHNLALQEIYEETPNVTLPKSRPIKTRK
jgi:hypothetical protein